MSKNRSTSLMKMPNKGLTPSSEHGVVMREKSAAGMGGGAAHTLSRTKKSGRRISCKELGTGDIEGWLITRKQTKSKWDSFHKWCILKSPDLYIYNSRMDTQASSKIHLPLFRVSEATEMKKKTAFKVHNHGTTFYFRTEKESEKYKWINMLSLAAIEYKVVETQSTVYSHLTTSQSDGSYCSTLTSSSNPGYSDESEDETSSEAGNDHPDLVMTRPRSRSNKLAPDRVTLTAERNPEMRKIIDSIHQADIVDVLGTDSETRRKSTLRQSIARYTVIANEISRSTSFKSNLGDRRKIKRAKVKGLHKELDDINYLLESPSPIKLNNFLSNYPQYMMEEEQGNPDQSDLTFQSNSQSIHNSSKDQSEKTKPLLHNVRNSCVLSADRPIIMSPILETDSDQVDDVLADLNSNNSNSNQLPSPEARAQNRATSDPNLVNHSLLLSSSAKDERCRSTESLYNQVYKGGKKHNQLSTEL